MNIVYAGHVFMGVDPGASGAAVTTSPPNITVRFSKLTEVEIWIQFRDIAQVCAEHGTPLTAIFENVSIRPEDGRGSGAKFMKNAGMLWGFLIAADIRRIKVTPSQWARKMGRIDPKGTTKSEKKRRNQDLADSLYPGRMVIRETADAFLLAEYGRRFHQ